MIRGLAGLILGLAFAAAAPGLRGSFVLLQSKADLIWSADPTVKDGSRALLLGRVDDPSQDSSAMIKWEPGTGFPWHQHPGHACQGVVLEGTVVVTTACGTSKELSAGSFFFIGGPHPHALRCKAGGAQCFMYVHDPNQKHFLGSECGQSPPPGEVRED
jgi:quercetin dioxygenase-like cupin family protein